MLRHVGRDISKKQMPKRALVIYDLFRFLIKDYLTIAITIILLVTGWRTLNTLEILFLYSQRHSYLFFLTKDRKEGAVLDYSIKDVSL